MCDMRDGTTLSKSPYWEACDTDPFELSQKAFREGSVIFKESLTKDPKKQDVADRLLSNCTLDDVIKTITDARDKYESSHAKSKFREVLTGISRRIVHYGQIMDVLVQQHPEYISLVWGAMKLIFGGIVEHERTGMVIATALHEILATIPMIKIGTELYPNKILGRSVSMLYAHIVEFLIRAQKHYEESKLAHVVNSIVNPSALRYSDLVLSIQRETEIIMKHMAVCSQAKIHDVHENTGTMCRMLNTVSYQMDSTRTMDQDSHQKTHAKISELNKKLDKMREMFEIERAVQACTRLQSRIDISDILLQQALESVSSRCSIKHKSVLWSAVHLYNQWQGKREFQFEYGQFWTSPKLREWNMSPASSTILIKSPLTARRQIMTFCTEVVDQLMRKPTTVLWVLAERNKAYSLPETLKSLVYQALRMGFSSRRENKMAFELSQFLDAYTEEDYLNLLAKLLQNFRLVYIIVNGDAMSPSTERQCRQCLHRLSCMLSDRKSQTLLKVITTSNRPERDDKLQDMVLTVEGASRKQIRKQRKHYVRRNIKMPNDNY
ncbi:hypothetical protein F4806DRAFT_477743 [Annulohypoxylon nitens]|nr:hypothetical protein F4806DRAFT_477743 [Annulohypoxylon nitens]